MRIGLVTTSYPRFPGDVAGSFVRGFARELVALGHRVDVVVPADERVSKPSLADIGIDIHHVAYLPRALRRTFYRAGAPENLASDRLAWLGAAAYPATALTTVARLASRWSLVVAHWALPSTLIAALAAPTLPRVSVWHSGDAHLASSLPTVVRRALAPLLRSQVHWFVSERTRAQASIRTRHRTIVAPMGAEPPALVPAARDELGLARDELAILSLGRLTPIKGVDRLIAALPPDMTLLVAGEGPERPRLEQQARELGKHVRFFGAVAGRDKDRLFHAADAFVLPSRELDARAEGAPVVIGEAQLAGLPIVASDTGGVADIHERLLVAPDDPLGLHRALEVLRAPALRRELAEASRARGTERTWDALRPTIERALVLATRAGRAG